ncbi:MAG: PaaI family thioesterase [bacterium]
MSVITEKSRVSSTGKGHTNCLMCGSRNPFSLGLRFHTREKGRVWARFKAKSRFQGYDGILHGGVISALLDAAMTHCLFQRGVKAVTGDMRVRFLKPISCGTELQVCAWPVSITPPLYRVAAELVLGLRVMAKAEAKFMQKEGW